MKCKYQMSIRMATKGSPLPGAPGACHRDSLLREVGKVSAVLKPELKTTRQIRINVMLAFGPLDVNKLFELLSLGLDFASYLAPGFVLDPLTFPTSPAWAERIPLPAPPRVDSGLRAKGSHERVSSKD